jgi:hypothetical protein
VLVVGLRSVIRDPRSSPKMRLSACRLLAICEGIIPRRKKLEKPVSKTALKPPNSGNLSHLLTLVEGVK